MPAPRPWPPVVAIGSAVEAFLREQRSPLSKPARRARTSLFATVGMIGFIGWMSWVSPMFLPVGNLLEVQDQAENLARAIRRCRKDLGRYPTQLSECSGAALFIQDIWGETFHYGLDARGFEIRSSGRDRQWGSKDDFVFHYR